MLARLLSLILLIVATPAWGQRDAADRSPVGSWAMKAEGGVTIARIEVAKRGDGWSGVWVRPTRLEFQGDDIAGVEGPAIRRSSIAGRITDRGVELTFADPIPGATPDVVRIVASDATHADLTMVGARVPPFALVRETTTAPIGPWDRARRYRRIVERPTNAEMTAMFDADQAARANPAGIDWSVLWPQDQQRQARTQVLLDAGALQSADDFYHAAFVFQHGSKPEDFLKAHVLATIAAARGRTDATWIAAATLDRYLQNIGRPQVFGTQYLGKPDAPMTQEPYDRGMLSDALRQAAGVPGIADQQVRLGELNKERAASMVAKP